MDINQTYVALCALGGGIGFYLVVAHLLMWRFRILYKVWPEHDFRDAKLFFHFCIFLAGAFLGGIMGVAVSI